MGIQLRWLDNEKTKLHIIFEKNWNIDDFQAMVLYARDMISAQEHTVHVIADFNNSSIPSSTMLVGIPFAVRHIQANQGMAVVVTPNEKIIHLANTAASMHPALRRIVKVVNSLEVAERILSHHQKQKRAIAQ